MTERKKTQMACFRLEPDKRLTPLYDDVSVKKYRAPSRKKMGMRVLDNFCEEHIM